MMRNVDKRRRWCDNCLADRLRARRRNASTDATVRRANSVRMEEQNTAVLRETLDQIFSFYPENYYPRNILGL
jgi:hypothetical protein